MQLLVNVLDEILKILESTDRIQISESSDQMFFLLAMDIACRSGNNVLVDRVEHLYVSPTNKVRMITFMEESA